MSPCYFCHWNACAPKKYTNTNMILIWIRFLSCDILNRLCSAYVKDIVVFSRTITQARGSTPLSIWHVFSVTVSLTVLPAFYPFDFPNSQVIRMRGKLELNPKSQSDWQGWVFFSVLEQENCLNYKQPAWNTMRLWSSRSWRVCSVLAHPLIQ